MFCKVFYAIFSTKNMDSALFFREAKKEKPPTTPTEFREQGDKEQVVGSKEQGLGLAVPPASLGKR
jgi:hypothetical protein